MFKLKPQCRIKPAVVLTPHISTPSDLQRTSQLSDVTAARPQTCHPVCDLRGNLGVSATFPLASDPPPHPVAPLPDVSLPMFVWWAAGGTRFNR